MLLVDILAIHPSLETVLLKIFAKNLILSALNLTFLNSFRVCLRHLLGATIAYNLLP